MTPGPWVAGKYADGSFEVAAWKPEGGTLIICSRGAPSSQISAMHGNADAIAALPDLVIAMRTIAEMPMLEQDNLLASNMRRIAQNALAKIQP